MSDIILICVGKLKEKYYLGAFEEYAKRLGGFCNFRCIELPEYRLSDSPSEKEVANALQHDAEAILSHIPDTAFVVSMCIEGKKVSSQEFSKQISDCFNRGKSKIVFIIGGSFGLADSVKARSDMKMSMSDMTFPHHLARIMLAEQIYRAFQIIAGSKYHK